VSVAQIANEEKKKIGTFFFINKQTKQMLVNVLVNLVNVPLSALLCP